MKNYYLLAGCLLMQLVSAAQNTGIGTTNPLQKLDVNGAIKIGNSTANEPGSIRYNNNNFEGGDGNNWRSLEALPCKAIIVAQEPDTAFLKTKGFSVVRTMDTWDTSFFTIPTNFPGAWSAGFPLSSGAAPAAFNNSAETVMYNGNYIFYGNDGFLYSYNTTAQTWTQLPNASPLGARVGFGMTRVGNDIYITGGWRFVNPNITIFNTAAKYSLTGNTWTAIANMPVGDTYQATIAAGTDIYILNGASTMTAGQFDYAKKLYRYNTLNNTWSGDLATAATPQFILQGTATGVNGKYTYAGGLIMAANGNQYMTVVSYDPATHAITSVTPPPPFPFQSTYAFNYTSLLIGASKFHVFGNIQDSTDINYNPGSPNAAITLNMHYEIDPATGILTKLSTCLVDKVFMNVWQYNPGTDRFYAMASNGNYFVFNRGGAQACNVTLVRRGYWSYMKKN